MEDNRNSELTVKCYFTDDNLDICKVLKDSILIFIKKEMEKLSSQNS